MLTKWVVETYKTLVEVALWIFLLVGGIFGATIGSFVNHGFLGFLVGAVAAFFGMAVLLGVNSSAYIKRYSPNASAH